MRDAELPLPLGLLFGVGVPLILFRVFDLDDFDLLCGVAAGCAIVGALVGVALDRHRALPLGRRVLHALGPSLGIPAGVAALLVLFLLVPGLFRGGYANDLWAVPLAAAGATLAALLLAGDPLRAGLARRSLEPRADQPERVADTGHPPGGLSPSKSRQRRV